MRIAAATAASIDTRFAVVSDIHGNLPALEAVVADLARRGIDRVVNLGDSLSGPLLPAETARYLMETGWLHLAGNHERQILAHGSRGHGAADAYARAQLSADQLAWIAAQRPTADLGDGVFVCHGSPRSDLEYFLETVDEGGMRAATRTEVAERRGDVAADLVACGHTHVPRAMRDDGGTLLVNPGSVGLPAWDDERPFHHAVENRSPDARYAVVERLGGRWSVALIAIPYDVEPMARLAERNHRPDWAVALRTGTVDGR